MKRMVKLIEQWEHAASGKMTGREYCMRLPVNDAARIAALGEMYPRRSETELISELLSATLDELENAMPYIPGMRVIAEDEEGNPIMEDMGPTPRFLELSGKHLAKLEAGHEHRGTLRTWSTLRERMREAAFPPHFKRERVRQN